MNPPNAQVIWTRISEHEGEEFQQMRGGAFRYAVREGYLVPDRTKQNIPRKHIEQALQFVPLTGPSRIQHVRGPSYIYALLMDERIRRGEW